MLIFTLLKQSFIIFLVLLLDFIKNVLIFAK